MGTLKKIATNNKEPETQSASPASKQSGKLVSIGDNTGKKITEAWRMATPSQTQIPAKSTQKGSLTPSTDSWRSKKVQAVTGGSRGGRTVTREVEVPTLAGRAADVVSGSAKQWGAGFVNTGGMALRGASALNDMASQDRQKIQAALDNIKRYEAQLSTAKTEAERQRLRMLIQRNRNAAGLSQENMDDQTRYTDKGAEQLEQTADRLSESGAADILDAKKGLGKTGGVLVDIGAAGLQMGADIGAGLLTGGGALVPMAVRSFGGAAQEARQEGATLGQQLAYGLGSAAVSVETEKLSNVVAPFAKAFGKGIGDDIVEAAIGKAVDRFAKTAAGKTALEGFLKTGAGFVSEGAEEFLEDVANPILKRMTYDPSAQFDLEEAVYDFLIGGALGGLGGAVESVAGAKSRYQGYRTQVQNTAIDQAYDTMREQGMFSQEARQAARDAQNIMPQLDPGGHIAWGRMMEDVAPEKREAFTQAREIAGRFGADLTVDKLTNGAAGEYRNNIITIDPTAENPVRQVLVHELTHHMETSGLYSQFSQRVLGFLAEDMGVDVDALRGDVQRIYQDNGVELDEDGASREMVAKFAEDYLFQDERSIQRLLQTDRNLFQRIYDWLRDAVAKVRGTSEERFLIDAQRLYEKALRSAGEQAGARAAQNTFAGVNARTADLRALQTAQEMERQGTDTDTIHRETGWYRGMDGKWRWEIDDSGMRYERSNVSRASRLGDYIQHEELFGAYPELKNVRVRFADLKAGEHGSFDRSTNTITLNQLLKSAPDDTLIHEVQHAIQQAEGFTGGASPGYWEIMTQSADDWVDTRVLQHRKEKIVQRMSELGDSVGLEAYIDALLAREMSGEITSEQADLLEKEFIQKNIPEYARLQEELYGDIYQNLKKISARKPDAESLYRNTAGEIEARDAAARRGLTAEERTLKMPQLGDENTVFADGVGTTLYMDTDADVQQGPTRPYYDPETGDIMLRDGEGQWKPRFSFIREEAARSVQIMGDRSPFSNGFDTRIVEDQTPLQAVRVQPGDIIYPTLGGRWAVTAEMDQARRAVNDLETGSVTNNWTGLNIQMGKDFFSESATNSAKQRNPDSLRTLGAARELMEQACLIGAVDTKIDSGSNLKKKNNPHRLFQYIFAAPYEMDGPKIAVLRVDVLENQGDAIHRAYNLRSIEYKNTPLSWVREENFHAGFQDRATASEAYTVSIADLAKNIKEEYVGNHVNISPDTGAGQFSMGPSLRELVQNQRDGTQFGSDGQIGIAGFDQGKRADWTQEELQADQLAKEAQERPAGTSSALEKVGVTDIAGDMADYRGTDFLRGADQAKKETARARRQAEARLQPSRGERQFAKGIANGDYTAEDIPASMSRATVTELADYYIAENSYKGTDGVQERGQEIRRKTERLAEKYFKDDAKYQPIHMLVMNERTPERVMRSIFGDLQGEKINEAYIYPVQQNEASKARFIQRQLNEVRTFEDSQGQRSGLTKEERAIVQQMLEDRFVGETIASMEMAEGIRNAAENIRHGEDPVDAAREFSLDAEERGLAQQFARWTENQELMTSGELDSVKINNAVQKFAEQYDLFYDAVNDFLTAHGYGTIGFIKGYAPHMQGADTQNKLLSALRAMGVNADASSLPTSISGLTADYKPGKRWNPFFQSRTGNKTDYDVSKGYESYVSYLGDIFYHTDDIARLRGVSRYLRKTFGPEEISHAIDHAESLRYADLNTQTEVLRDAGKISEGTKLTYQDARTMMDQYINELYDNVTKTTKYGELVKYIDNYANLLAGKQSMADRGMEYMAGRTSLNAGNKLVAAFGRAQVAGNMSSVLNQSAQLAQILAEVDGKYVAQAAADLAKSTSGKIWNIKKTALFDQSDLLTGKKGIDYLTADDSRFDSVVTAMFKPADIMDGLVSALAVQSKYNQLVAEGKPSEAAMLEADRWATQIMGSRMKGSRPLAFESKSVVNQMLHMFQVEALNSWEHITQDLPAKYQTIAKEHGKKAGARAVAAVVTKGLLSAFLLNRITEGIYGGTPAPFDLLGYLANFVASGMGMSTNAMLKGVLKPVINTAWEKMFGSTLFDDDDDEEDKPFDWKSAGGDLLYNISNDVPFVRNAAGLLGLGDQTMPFTNMAEAVQGIGRAVAAEDPSAGEIGGAVLDLGKTLVPGGRQLQKTTQGIQTMLDGGRNYGYGDKRRLQYPVEQRPDKWLQAVLFGNSGLSETRDFYASGESGLSAKQSDLVELMVNEGADRATVYQAVQNVRKGEDTREKLELLENEKNLTDRQCWQMYTKLIASKGAKKPSQFRKMMMDGMSWQQISDAYQEYLALDDVEDMGASEKATQFEVYLDQSGMTEKQKGMIKDALKFYSQIPAEADRYTDLTDAGLSSTHAASLAKTIGSLKPQAGQSSVSNIQRYKAVVTSAISASEQMKALESMMDETEYEKLEAVYNAGLTPKQYVDFREATQDMTADKDANGKTISGSKKEKVLTAIDAMPVSNEQKTALYYAEGYKESTLDDAPWHGKNDDIMPKLGGSLLPVASGGGRTGHGRLVDIDDIMPKLVK